MMICIARFNRYLSVALVLLLVVAAGCQSSEKKKKEKEQTIVELYQEVTPDGVSATESVPIYRQSPVYVNVDKEPFLDSADLTGAKLLSDMGGFVIQLSFNWRGTQVLYSITTANRGKRVAVKCKFVGENRWLASPVINRPISDGVLTFTPDATREEAERIVKGLNLVAEELKKKDKL